MSDTTYIYGKHALEAALKHNPEAIKEVLFADNLQDDSLRDRTKHQLEVPIHTFGAKHPPGGVDPEAVHQGVVIRVRTDRLMRDYDQFMEDFSVTPETSVVVLAEVQDPHNVGAIIRNAYAFGVEAVFIPEHNQAQVTAAVVKVSAGTAFKLPLVSIGNVNMTLDKLKERDFWVYGLAGEGSELISEQEFSTPTAFVIGNEGSGLREKTAEHCDKLITIPTTGGQSLNAAAASAVAFYDWQKKQGE